MIWIILGLTIAAVGTFALLVFDLLQEKRDSDALDEFDGHQAAPEFVGAGGHQPGRFDPEV